MSHISNKETTLLDSTSFVLKNICCTEFFGDIDKILQKLLGKEEIKHLLDDKNVDEITVNKFIEIYKSVKLLLEIYERDARNNEKFEVAIPVEEILQNIRDLFDLAVEIPGLPDAFPYGLFYEIMIVLFSIISIHPCDRYVRHLAAFYQYNLHLVKIRHGLESVESTNVTKELLLRLKILSGVFNTLLECQNHFQKYFMKHVKDIEIPDSISENVLLSRLITKSSDAVAAETLLCIIPKYISFMRSNDVLQYTWNEISEGSVGDSRAFLILCYLFDLYVEDLNLLLEVFKNEDYWILIQNGLMYSDPLIRKQALFLFKKSIDVLSKNDYKFCCEKDNNKKHSNLKLKNGLKNIVINDDVMWWDPNVKKELFDIYRNVFSIIETLEEKQVHIIKPTFDIVKNVMRMNVTPFQNGKIMHISWIFVILQRIITHDNVSVVKWGILHLLKIPLDVFHDAEQIMAVVKLLVSSLNNNSLYVTDGSSLCTDLESFLALCSTSQFSQLFFKLLLKEICMLTWSPESLFYVVNSLANVSKSKIWDEDEIVIIKNFISTAINTHYTYIRSGIQCQFLSAVINLTDAANVKLEMIASLLGCFRGKESLQRGGKLWEDVVHWIEYCYSKQNAEEFFLKFITYDAKRDIDEKCIAKMIVILHDAHLFGIMKCCGETPSCKILNAISTVLSSFTDCDKRMYNDTDLQNHNLTIIYNVLNETLNVENPERSRLVEIMLPYFPHIIAYLHMQLKLLHQMQSFYILQLYINAFDYILKAQQLYKIDSVPFISNLLSQVLSNLEKNCNGTQEISPIQQYFSMKLLQIIIRDVYSDKVIPKLKFFQSYFKTYINSPLMKGDNESKLTKDLQVLWGQMNSEYLEAKWWILQRLMNENICSVSNGSMKIQKFVTSHELLSFCLDALEIGGYNVLLPVLSVLEDIIVELEDYSQLKKVIDLTWMLTLERKKTDQFWLLVRSFIRMLFQEELLEKQDEIVRSTLIEYSKRIFADSANGLPVIFIKHIQTIGIKYHLGPVFCDILALGLLFGPVQRKDERLTNQVCSLIESLNISPLTNDWCSSNEVRARTVQILLTLNPSSDNDQVFASELVSKLIEMEDDVSKSKTRYFGDSYVHRVKHRLMQSLLLLEPFLLKDDAQNLCKWLCKKMTEENHQPSVRYQQEWLLVKLLHEHPELLRRFFEIFDEALEKRTGSLCSFIAVTYHLCKILPLSSLPVWIDRAMQQFLPYCMAQHFSVRLYSQVTLQKLWELAKKRDIDEIINKYQIINNSLINSIEKGNAVKNCIKLQEDFYFTIFDPLEHYALQTIYYDLPRLANIGSDELISSELFDRCGMKENVGIRLKSENYLLEKCAASNWALKSGHVEYNEEVDLKTGSMNFQKKMIPLKSIIPDFEILNVSEEIVERKGRKKSGGLIVVASLIDRAPNLGGLGRTCEVFGVSEYVLGSLKYTEDKQFQSLSVTAEKWIPISEVKPHHLSNYLIKMKQNGYTVLGAEQTANSESLNSVKFPKKSLLLLGNEKEGIPPELLPLLDICIEIPQLGIVRSLNVHVTGALFIWEYAKQHCLTST